MFTPSEIAVRIKQCAKTRGLTVKSILQESGVGEKLVSNMNGKNGSYPQSDKIAKIADYLNVSVDYLLGRLEKENTAVIQTEDSGVNKLIEEYTKLNEQAQKELLNYAQYMTSKPENIKQDENKRAV